MRALSRDPEHVANLGERERGGVVRTFRTVGLHDRGVKRRVGALYLLAMR